MTKKQNGGKNTMTEEQVISKIQRYIDLTAVPDSQYYDIPGNELSILYHSKSMDSAEKLHLAFEYGRAKGYRQGRKENQKA